jgi:hypothetical protein
MIESDGTDEHKTGSKGLALAHAGFHGAPIIAGGDNDGIDDFSETINLVFNTGNPLTSIYEGRDCDPAALPLGGHRSGATAEPHDRPCRSPDRSDGTDCGLTSRRYECRSVVVALDAIDDAADCCRHRS